MQGCPASNCRTPWGKGRAESVEFVLFASAAFLFLPLSMPGCRCLLNVDVAKRLSRVVLFSWAFEREQTPITRLETVYARA